MARTLTTEELFGTESKTFTTEELFGKKPEFDPEGIGYDEDTAVASGGGPDERGHWGSLDPRTGMVLKGKQHKTWDLMESEEYTRGNKIVKKEDGRYYSVKDEDSFKSVIAEDVMPELRVPEKDQPSFLSDAYNRFQAGLGGFNAALARIPAGLYDMAMMPGNFLAKAMGQPDKQVQSPEWLMDNMVAKAYDKIQKNYTEKAGPRQDFTEMVKNRDYKGITRSIALQVIENAPHQIGIIASYMAGIPAAGLVGMGAISGTQALKEGRTSGADPAMNTYNALANGVIEAGFESIGTMGLLKHWEKALAKSFGTKQAMGILADVGKAVIASMAGEGNEEFLTSFGQDFSAMATGVNPQAMKGSWMRALEAGLVGAGSGGVMTAPSAVAMGISSADKAKDLPVRYEDEALRKEIEAETGVTPTIIPKKGSPAAEVEPGEPVEGKAIPEVAELIKEQGIDVLDKSNNWAWMMPDGKKIPWETKGVEIEHDTIAEILDTDPEELIRKGWVRKSENNYELYDLNNREVREKIEEDIIRIPKEFQRFPIQIDVHKTGKSYKLSYQDIADSNFKLQRSIVGAEVIDIYKREVAEIKKTIKGLNIHDLEELMDIRYKAEAPQEELDILEDEYATRISEEYLDISEEDVSMSEENEGGTSIGNQLANMYYRYITPDERQGMSEKDILSNMRSALQTAGVRMGGFKGATDKQILDAAKDTYERKLSLIERYKKGKKAKPKEPTPEKITGFNVSELEQTDTILQDARKYENVEEFNESIIQSLKTTFANDPETNIEQLKKDNYILDTVKTEDIDDSTWTKLISKKSREKIDVIKKALQEGKLTPPIIISKGPPIDGHHRLQAYKELGIEYIPVLKVIPLSKGEKATGKIVNLNDIWKEAHGLEGTRGVFIPYFKSTNEAEAFGRKHKGDEQVKAGLEYTREEAIKESRKYKDSTDIKEMQKGMDEATKAQFAREALEAMEEPTPVKKTTVTERRKIPKEIEQEATKQFGKEYSRLTTAQKKKVLKAQPGESFVVYEQEMINLAKSYPGYDKDVAQNPTFLNPKTTFSTDGKYLITDNKVASKIKEDFWNKEEKNSIKDFQKDGASFDDAKAAAKRAVKGYQESAEKLDYEVYTEPTRKKAIKPLEFIGVQSSEDNIVIAIYSDGENHYALNSKYVKMLSKYYPNVKFKGDTPSTAAAIYSDGSFKGIILPMKLEGIKLPLTLKEGKPTQKAKVKKALEEKPKDIKKIAEETDILEPNVRRILGVGTKEGTFERIDKGVYRLKKQGKDIVYIHTGDAVDITAKLAREKFKADMIFLDIPYKTPAVVGGNRGIKYQYITPEQFKKVVLPLTIIARNNDTPVFYMYSQAKSGQKEMQKYNNVFTEYFKPIARGKYTKFQKDGTTRVRNMRGEIIEPEAIILASVSGKVDFDTKGIMDYNLVRPRGYQTEKPAEMLKDMIKMSTGKGAIVFDPFAGSGVALEQAVKEERKATGIEISEKAVKERIIPRVEKAAREGKTYTVYQGRGRAIEDIYSNVAKPVLGDANYYAFSAQDAKAFGTVTKKTINIKNPLVIDSDNQWWALAKEAGWKYPSLDGMGEQAQSNHIDNMKRLILSKGHDSVIIKLDKKGDSTKTMVKKFGIDQIIDYTGLEESFKPPVELSPAQKKRQEENELNQMIIGEKQRIDMMQDLYKEGKVTKERRDEEIKELRENIKKYEGYKKKPLGGGAGMAAAPIRKEGPGEYKWNIGNAEGYISKTSKGWKVHQTKPFFDTNTYDTFKEAKESLVEIDSMAAAPSLPNIPKITPKTYSGYGTIETSEKSLQKKEKVAKTDYSKLAEEMPKELGFIDDLLKIVAPAERIGAETGKKIIRKNLAEFARKAVLAQEILKKAHKAFRWMSKEDSYDFLEKAETGEEQPNATLKGISELATKQLDKRVEIVRSMGKGYLENLIDNYWPHFWKDPVKARNVLASILSKRKLEGTKGFLKKRVIPTIKEGMELGLEPVSDNPIDLILLKLYEMDRFIMAQELIRDLKTRRQVKFVYERSKGPEGWRAINDNLFTVFMPPNIKKKEFYDRILVSDLMDIATSLGIDAQRFVNIGGKRAGYVEYSILDEKGEKIRTRFATPESVLIHEIGHVLGKRYDLYNLLRRKNDGVWKMRERGEKAGQRYFAPSPESVKYREVVEAEWRKLADARYKHIRTTEGFKKYVRKGSEKEAVLLEALIHAPEEFKRLAPELHKVFTNFLNTQAELRPLLDTKPSLVLGADQVNIAVPGVTKLGKFMAPEPVARILNNYLSPGLRNAENKLMASGYDILRGAGNILNQAQLAFSAFHALNVTSDMMASTFGLGIRKLMTKGQRIQGLTDLLTFPAAPIVSIFRGSAIRKAYAQELDTIKNPHTKLMVKALIAAGGRDRMDAFYYNAQIKALGKTLSDIWKGSPAEKLKGALKMPFNLTGAFFEFAAKPLMQWYVPTGKIGLFARLAEHEMRRRTNNQITDEQLWERLTQVWDNVDNRMGQLVYDNLFWNKTMKDVTMLAVRSTGWNLGSWREFGGAAVDLFTVGERIKRGDKWFSQKMAYTTGSVIVYSMLGAVIQKILTGKAPEEPKDYLFPKTGQKNPDGSPERLSLPTYAKDWYAWSHRPLATATHKIHPLWGVLGDLATNKDYFNTEIRHTDDPLMKQANQVARYIARSFRSISMRNMEKMQRTTPGEPLRNAFVSLTGIVSAPAYLTRSTAQKLMARILSERIPEKSRTKEEFEKNMYRKTLINRLRKGEPIDRLEAIEILGNRSYSMALRDARKTHFAASFNRLSVDEAVDVYAVSTPKERNQVKKLLQRKISTYGKTKEYFELYRSLL